MNRLSRYCIVAVTLVIIATLVFPGKALAFQGGYHFDLTRDCLIMEGFSQNAIQMAQVSNWYDDAYDMSGQSWIEGAMVSNLFPDVASSWDAAAGMHFIHFQDYSEVEAEWKRLETNTYAMSKLMENKVDVPGLLMIIGASLHWLQDFYAHSNWADLDWGGDATWFDISAEEKLARIERGEIEIYTAYLGDRSHDAINMDTVESLDRGRPFEKAYREAFYATCQWVSLIKSWVNPEFWNAAKSYSNDWAYAEEAWARQMMWYVGTWKGSWSKSSEDVVRVAALHLDYGYPGQHIWEQYASALSRGDYDVHPVSNYAYIEGQNWLVIDSGMVRQTDCSTFEDIDPGDQADFYAKISVDENREYIEAFDEGHDVLYPKWLTIIPFRKDITSIHLVYSIWDDDGGTSSDDHCDIAYERNGVRDWIWDGSPWDLNSINAGTIAEGRVETNGLQRCDSSCFLGICDRDSIGDGDEASVWFKVQFGEQPRVEAGLRILEPIIIDEIIINPDLFWTATPTSTLTATPTATQAPSITPTRNPTLTATYSPDVTPTINPTITIQATSSQTSTTVPGSCPLGLGLIVSIFIIPVLVVRRPKRMGD